MIHLEIRHDYFDETLDQIHIEKVKQFKEVASEVLSAYTGIYIFEYISKYQQFDFIENSNNSNISPIHINLIEQKIPNCFI